MLKKNNIYFEPLSSKGNYRSEIAIMYACVYVKIEWVMCIRYILYRYNIYILYLHKHTLYIFTVQTHFGTLNVFFQFHWAGMNQSMLDSVWLCTWQDVRQRPTVPREVKVWGHQKVPRPQSAPCRWDFLQRNRGPHSSITSPWSVFACHIFRMMGVHHENLMLQVV